MLLRLAPQLCYQGDIQQGVVRKAAPYGHVPRHSFVSHKLAPKLAQQLKVRSGSTAIPGAMHHHCHINC